jgi:hypothetical protein
LLPRQNNRADHQEDGGDAHRGDGLAPAKHAE